jgi:hypothetical protein
VIALRTTNTRGEPMPGAEGEGVTIDAERTPIVVAHS